MLADAAAAVLCQASSPEHLPLRGSSTLLNLGFYPALKVIPALLENRTFREEMTKVKDQLWKQ